jgi:hypothetical protein
LQALDDDPKLLAVRPTPPSTGLNHLKPFNVSTVLIAVHKDSYTSLKLTNKAASTGGRQFVDNARAAPDVAQPQRAARHLWLLMN